MIFNDNIARPYVYLITFNDTKEYYFGYRERNRVAAKFDIGVVYFTSSRKIQLRGFENTTVEIINEFEGDNAGDSAWYSEQGLIWQNWGDPLMLNGNVRLYSNKKRFKSPKRTKEQNRANSERQKGEKSPNFGKKLSFEESKLRSDQNKYEWIHKDHGIKFLTRFELIMMYPEQKLWSHELKKVIDFKYSNHKGWFLSNSPTNCRKGKNHWKYDSTIYHWKHLTNIEEFLSRYDFIKKYNLNECSICNLLAGRSKSVKGWFIVQ